MKETGISKNNKTDGSGVTGKLYIGKYVIICTLPF